MDVTLYRAILRVIQRDERKRGALASFAFIVQEEDIREIVELIWHGHSILSQCDTRKEIRYESFVCVSHIIDDLYQASKMEPRRRLVALELYLSH